MSANEITRALACGKGSCICAATARKGFGLTHCPAHDDRNPSLNVSAKAGRLLVSCHADCNQEAVIAALKERKLWPESEPEAIFDYVDEAGRLLYQKVRFAGKKFVQRRSDGNGGWIWNLDGMRRVPYRLPELLASEVVVFEEGEKHVDRLIRLGISATTTGDAESWRPEFAAYFKDRVVALCPDNDPPGRKYVDTAAKDMQPVAKGILLVTLPGVPPKGDVLNWLDNGGTGEQLKELIRTAPEWVPSPRISSNGSPAPKGENMPAPDHLHGMNAAELLALNLPDLRQHFEGLLPEGLGLVGAPPKAGKSLFCYQLGAELATCGSIFGIRAVERTPVRYYALEDGQRRSQRRMRAALKGRTSGIEALELEWTAPRLGSGLEEEVSTWLDGHPNGVVIIDVLAKVRPNKGSRSLNAYDEDYQALTALHNVSRSHPGATILLVTHDRKAGSEDWMTRVTGTRGVTGAVDFVIFLHRPRTEALGTLFVSGRDIPDTSINVNFTGEGWERATIQETVRQESSTRQKIFDWVEANGPATPLATAIGTNLSHDVTRHRMPEMAKAGHLVVAPGGLYRVPEDE